MAIGVPTCRPQTNTSLQALTRTCRSPTDQGSGASPLTRIQTACTSTSIKTYGVYDFTNLALLSKWQLFTAVTDTLWGGTLFYLTTVLVQKVLG